MEKPSKTFLISLAALCVVLILSNSFLIVQNLRLRSQLVSMTPRATPALKEGDRAGSFSARDLDGNVVLVDLDGTGAKRALLFFSTTCPFCHKQFPYWQQLLSLTDQKQYRLTALTTETDAEAIRKYLHSMNCDQLEVLSITPEVATKYKLNVTPITLVIDQNAVVEKAWSGMWREDSLAAASSYFAVNFTSPASP